MDKEATNNRIEVTKAYKIPGRFEELQIEEAIKGERSGREDKTAIEMIKQKLERKGMSQAELARQMGCDPSYVNKCLRGNFCISDSRVRSFCYALGLNISTFRTAVRIQNCQNEHIRLQLKYRDVWEEAIKWK